MGVLKLLTLANIKNHMRDWKLNESASLYSYLYIANIIYIYIVII